jgi:nicotinamidase-related amidase
MENNNNLKLILPEECLLLIIDLQDKFLPFLKHSARVLHSTKLLIAVAGELHIPIVVSEHNPKRIGPTVQELAVKLKDVPRFPKDVFSCFGDPAIKKAIQAHKNLKNILIVGFTLATTFMWRPMASAPEEKWIGRPDWIELPGAGQSWPRRK